jgi:CDP-glycerol glycerophosphotransferase
MTLDIIIPAYNAHDTIDRALASIAMQQIDPEDDVQVVIVNDASPNGSYHDCAKYWAIQMPVGVIDRKENGGCGQARQTGLDATNGEAVVFLDADDVLGSPFALRVLLDGMKLGYDMVMGMFVEETEQRTMINHGANYVWCHGKCYSRKFINEHGLRFNDTRGNEDVGFNAVYQNLTENILYIPQVVYIWENRKDSTVRTDHNAYSYGHGWRDFVTNMNWAEAEMEKRGVSKEKIAAFLGQVVGRLYWQTMECHEVLPKEERKNWAALKDFYESCLGRNIENGVLTKEALREGYMKVTGETPQTVVPFMTFNGFMKKLGYKE